MATPVLSSLTDNSARDGTGDVIEGAEIDANPNTLARILDGTTETMLNQDTSASDGLRIRVPEITDISAAAGGIRTGLRLRHDPSSGTVGDNDGIEILIQGDDDAGNKTSFAEIETYFTDVSNGSEDADVVFKTMIGGTAREMLSIGSTGFIFNEDSQDLDFRLETNNIANGFVSDAGLDTFAFGKAAVDDKFVSISTPTATHTATTDTYAFHIAPGGAQTIPSGTTALVASAAIEEPNITATGTVTSAATLYIKNAPTEGSSNYALWVDDGAVQIDSNLTVGGNITVTGGMTVAGANAFDIGDSDKLLLGDSDDLTVYHDGSNSYITNATGALKLATETSGIAVTIGHSTSETTVADNLTVTGTTTATGGIELSHASANTLTASSGILSIEGVAIPTISSTDTLTNKTITSPTINTPTITGNTTFSDGSYDFNIASHDGTNGLSLAGTVVTASAAELNLTDGATVTTAELNLIDGDTARGTTAVASGDGILINDGGTMRMTNVDTVSTYFSSHNVGGSNIVTTGALNSGSITSGFGTINTGSSTITTTGAVATGALTATGAVTATDTTAPLILKYDAGEYVTHAVSSAGVYSIATTDASSDSGAITLDTVDSITLDSDTASEGIVYADGGTNLMRIFNSSSDVILKPLVDAKDIVIQQYDGNEVCRFADNRRLYFYDEGGEYISSSGSALTIASGGVAWELPTADGSADQVLKTDGSGNLDWVNNAGSGGISWDGSTANGVATYKDGDEATVESNLTFDGSTLQVTGALTVGVDDTGHDVKFFGATSNRYMLWDESGDLLNLRSDLSVFRGSNGTDRRFFVDESSGGVSFNTDSGSVAPDGHVHIHSGSAGTVSASVHYDDLVVEGSGNTGISILAPEDSTSGIAFGSNNDNDIGYIYAQHSGTATSRFMAFAVNAAERLRIKSDGDIQVGANADIRIGNGVLDVDATETYGNSFMSQGVTLNQGGSDNEIMAFKANEVDHNMTSTTEGDTFGRIKKADATEGGMMLTGFSEATIGTAIQGAGESDTTTKSTSGVGYIDCDAYKSSGGGGLTAPGADANLFSVRKGGSVRFIVDEDGDVHYDGTTNASAWDDYDDVGLLNAFRNLTTAHKAQDVFGEFVEKNAQILRDTGVITMNDDGHHFVSTKGLNALIIDTIRQEGQKWRKVVGEYQDKIAALESRLLRLEA